MLYAMLLMISFLLIFCVRTLGVFMVSTYLVSAVCANPNPRHLVDSAMVVMFVLGVLYMCHWISWGTAYDILAAHMMGLAASIVLQFL